MESDGSAGGFHDGGHAMMRNLMRMMMGGEPPEIEGLPPGADPNLLFYRNELASRPDGDLIGQATPTPQTATRAWLVRREARAPRAPCRAG